MKDSFDYGQNPLKTRDGELVSSYMCDPQTAYEEFLLSKAKYRAVTGREQKKDDDILFYQIRQAFPPGEISHDDALKIGYDTAMRWTKGKHAFFVVSHSDRPHPHVHIYYNSTALDCTRKFRNFWGSTFAVRRLSDRVCLENGLSYIAHPKLHSKSKFQHYGQWLGDEKAPTFQGRLRAQLDTCLAEQPGNFEDFLRMMAAAGYEIKRRGETVSFRIEGQTRFTRLRASTLGEGYGQEDIIAAIDGRVKTSGGRAGREPSANQPRRVNLIVDIQEKIKAGKGPAYQRWATVYNLKQMAPAPRKTPTRRPPRSFWIRAARWWARNTATARCCCISSTPAAAKSASIGSTDTSTNGVGALNPIRYRGYYYGQETGFYFLQTRSPDDNPRFQDLLALQHADDTYNPNWAVYPEDDGDKKLYFILEAKGTSEFRIALEERLKYRCGKGHFKVLDPDIKMRMAHAGAMSEYNYTPIGLTALVSPPFDGPVGYFNKTNRWRKKLSATCLFCFFLKSI